MLNVGTIALALLLLWQTPQRPAFRSEVNYVELDVSVLDKAGARVRGLTKDDFEVLENGKPQTVGSFAAVELPLPATATATSGPIRVIHDDGVATNVGTAEGRVYVIVMDYGTLAAEGTPKVKKQIAQFITDFLAPNDLAAVVSLGSTPHATEFTANKARLFAALNVTSEFVGSAADLAKDLTPTPSGTKNDDAFDDTVAAYAEMEASRMVTASIDGFTVLGNVAKYLRGMQGRRKSLIYVSQGIDPFPVTAGGTGSLAQNAVAGAVKRVTEILQGTGVTVYTIDPRGMAAVDPYDGGGSEVALSSKVGPGYLGPMALLRGLADDTGGIAAIGYGDLTGPYRRIVEDNSNYYVIGYASDQKLDNGMHSIRVRVRGRDVEVRTRDHIMAAKPAAPKAGEAALTKAWLGEDIASLLARPLPAGDLGLSMRATASTIAVREHDAVVQLSVEVGGAGFTFQPANEIADTIDVAFQAFDTTRKLAAGREDHIKLSLSADTRDAVTRRGWRYVTEFTVPSGLYELKIAAAEANGHHAGSVFLDVPVPDTSKAPLSILGLALTSQAARGVPTAGTTPTVRAASLAPVSPSRSFSRADTITVLAGIIDTLPGDRAVTIAAKLRAHDGTTAIEMPMTMKASDLREAAVPRVFVLPLKNVAEGNYDLVVSEGDGAKTVSKTVPITIVR